MKRKSLNLSCVLVVGAMFVAAFLPIGSVVAPVTQQHNIWGTDAQSGIDQGGATSVSDGSEITAWIDGVSYGLNTTENSQYDLYVDGDTWGVEPDNWVKDGGYDGDSIQYFLDYTPSLYHLQISDYTSTFESGSYENDDTLFFDTQTDTDSNYLGPGGTYLRGLKINEIVFSPWPYVYIWDRNGELDETYLEDATHGYYLEKDDPDPTSPPDPNGPYFEFSVNPNAVVPFGAPNYYYVNLSGFALNDDDELKLVWKNPANWGGTPTANNIANGTDVIVDRVEWGNHQNFFDGPDPLVQDYDNTILSNIVEPIPVAGQCFRLTTNGTDTDNPASDFSVLPATPWPPASGGGGMPGEPTALRVHKSGANDLMLNWTAPTTGFGNLVKNIVYYDSDLSDGFQYTSFLVFDPDNSGLGTEDGAVLFGFLADGNEYAFIVHTTGDATQGGPNENPTNTNVGYKYIEDLLKNLTTTSQMFISIPYFTDWTKASDIAGPGMEFQDESIIDSLLIWNYSTQKLDYRTYGIFGWDPDFDIHPGDILGVTIRTTSPYSWKIVGAYDDTFEFTLLKNPSTTSQIFCSLPFHTSYQMASDIAGPSKDFDDDTIVDSVLKWNYTTQILDYRTYGIFGWDPDFDIDPMPGGHVGFTIRTTSPTPWKPAVMGL